MTVNSNLNASTELPVSLFKRLDQPLFATFVTSFIIWNWKFFYVLLTTFVHTENRIETAVTYLVNQKFFHLNYFWGPVVITIIFILFVPFINRMVLRLQLYFQSLEQIDKAESNQKTEELIFEKLAKTNRYIEDQKEISEKIIKEKLALVELRQNRVDSGESKPLYAALEDNIRYDISRFIEKCLFGEKLYVDEYEIETIGILVQQKLISTTVGRSQRPVQFLVTDKGKGFLLNYITEYGKSPAGKSFDLVENYPV